MVWVLAVYVQPVQRTRYLALEAVVVLEDALSVQAVVRAYGLVRGARDHKPPVFFGDAPLAVFVFEAHLEYVAVVVKVVWVEARLLFRLRPGPHARPQGVGRRQVTLGAVRGEAGGEGEGLPGGGAGD